MQTLALDQTLPTYELKAKNYAFDSDNKMHGDEAVHYGFRGGLVPGVGVYAYMTHPVVEALGTDWLERGVMTGKFLKPVYDGDAVTVTSRVVALDPVRIEIEARNSEGTLCGVATAELGAPEAQLDTISPGDFPHADLPDPDNREPAGLASLPKGKIFGSLETQLDRDPMAAEMIDQYCESLPIYGGPSAPIHPAFCPSQGNEILVRNVLLGPWIHVSTTARHIATPQWGETVSLRGRVSDSYEKRGHEYAIMNLALFGKNDRPLAAIEHTAIVRPRRLD